MIKPSNNLEDLPAYFNSIETEFFIMPLNSAQVEHLKYSIVDTIKPVNEAKELMYKCYNELLYYNEDNFGYSIPFHGYKEKYAYLNVLYCLLTKKVYLFMSNDSSEVYGTEPIFISKRLDDNNNGDYLDTVLSILTDSLRRELLNYLRARDLII